MHNISAKIIFIIVVSIIYVFVKENFTILDTISYVFILFSYILFITVPYFSKGNLNKTIKDLPVYASAFVYLLLEISLAVYTSYKGFEDIKHYILIKCLLTGMFLIVFFILLDVNLYTGKSIREQQKNIDFIETIRMSLNSTLLYTKNPADRNSIQNLLEILKSVPIKPRKNVYALESDIINKIKDIENQTKNNNPSINISKELTDIRKLLLEKSL